MPAGTTDHCRKSPPTCAAACRKVLRVFSSIILVCHFDCVSDEGSPLLSYFFSGERFFVFGWYVTIVRTTRHSRSFSVKWLLTTCFPSGRTSSRGSRSSYDWSNYWNDQTVKQVRFLWYVTGGSEVLVIRHRRYFSVEWQLTVIYLS